jgi:hypothetical protein
MPEALGDRNVIVDCLSSAYEERIEELSGLRALQEGSLVLEPRMRFRSRAKPIVEESDAYPWMSGGPQAEAFNAFIAKAYDLDRWRMDTKGAFPVDDDDARYHARRSYSATRFDRRIVSIQVATDDYAGGNHDARGQIGLTWDLAKQRRVTLDDLFAKGSRWKAVAVAYCKRNLHEQFAEHGAPDLSDEEIAATVANSSAWLWGEERATVVFFVDLIGGLPGGEFDVQIPVTMLARFMVDDAAVK